MIYVYPKNGKSKIAENPKNGMNALYLQVLFDNEFFRGMPSRYV